MVATRAASLLGLNPPEGATTVSWASVPERPLSAEGELRGYVELPGEVDRQTGGSSLKHISAYRPAATSAGS